eukprot:6492721-Amphidinium_carterae.5
MERDAVIVNTCSVIYLISEASAKRVGRKGGGSWRAFLHLRVRGTTGRADMSELSRAYWAEGHLDPAVRKLGELGAEASALEAVRCPSRSSFGPLVKYVRKSVQKKARKAFWGRTAGFTSMERAKRLAHAWQGRSRDLSEAIKQVNKLQQMDGQEKKNQSARDIGILENFKKQMGSQQMQNLGVLLPGLQPVLPMLEPVPNQGGMLFSAPARAFDEATTAAAQVSWSRKTNLSHSLETEWSHSHRPIVHDCCRPLTSIVKETSKCQVAGVCLCSHGGKTLLRFRQAVWQAVKKAFPTKAGKDKVSAGDVVMQFLDSGPISDDDECLPPGEAWFHLGFVLWNPLAMSLLKLCKVPTPAYAMLPGESSKYIYLQAVLLV